MVRWSSMFFDASSVTSFQVLTPAGRFGILESNCCGITASCIFESSSCCCCGVSVTLGCDPCCCCCCCCGGGTCCDGVAGVCFFCCSVCCMPSIFSRMLAMYSCFVELFSYMALSKFRADSRNFSSTPESPPFKWLISISIRISWFMFRVRSRTDTSNDIITLGSVYIPPCSHYEKPAKLLLYRTELPSVRPLRPLRLRPAMLWVTLQCSPPRCVRRDTPALRKDVSHTKDNRGAACWFFCAFAGV